MNYIFYKEVPSKNKEILNMSALVIITRSKYTRLLSFTSIKNENSSKDFIHFFDLNEASKDASNNIKKSQLLFSNFESNFFQKSNIEIKKIHVEGFSSIKD